MLKNLNDVHKSVRANCFYLSALFLAKWEIAFRATKETGHILQTYIALETTWPAALFWSSDNSLFSKNNFSGFEVFTRKDTAAAQ
jgi:hypothetical protein